MRRKTIGAVVGVVLALAVAATAVAATTGGATPLGKLFAADRAEHRAQLAHDLAGKLGVPEVRVTQALDQVRSERQQAHLREHAQLLAKQLNVPEQDAQRALEQARSDLAARRSAGGPPPARGAFVQSIARSLHKTPAEVKQALKAIRKQMLDNRLSQAVANGTLTKQQADQIRQRRESGAFRHGRHAGHGWRGFGGPPPGPDGPSPPPGGDGP
jgi:ribosomal protein S9